MRTSCQPPCQNKRVPLPVSSCNRCDNDDDHIVLGGVKIGHKALYGVSSEPQSALWCFKLATKCFVVF